jgi:phage FluMu protein Com
VGWEPGKPSQNEDEYFARRDAEWVKSRRAELDRQEAAAAKSASGVKCPRCGNTLTEREFQHVKLDACDRCKGVWFDAGELEMVLLLKKGDQVRVITGLAK